MNSEIKKVLITVKAYPNTSRTYKESVCAAGIDVGRSEWVRLYPIPFRDLEKEKRFKKYSIVEIEVSKPKKDNRPESFKVNNDSIKILDLINTDKDWERRKRIILPTSSNSMCEILDKSKTENKSMGMFKPHKIKFEYKRRSKEEMKKRQKDYSQLSFYNPTKKKLEIIPYKFNGGIHFTGVATTYSVYSILHPLHSFSFD